MLSSLLPNLHFPLFSTEINMNFNGKYIAGASILVGIGSYFLYNRMKSLPLSSSDINELTEAPHKSSRHKRRHRHRHSRELLEKTINQSEDANEDTKKDASEDVVTTTLIDNVERPRKRHRHRN